MKYVEGASDQNPADRLLVLEAIVVLVLALFAQLRLAAPKLPKEARDENSNADEGDIRDDATPIHRLYPSENIHGQRLRLNSVVSCPNASARASAFENYN